MARRAQGEERLSPAAFGASQSGAAAGRHPVPECRGLARCSLLPGRGVIARSPLESLPSGFNSRPVHSSLPVSDLSRARHHGTQGAL